MYNKGGSPRIIAVDCGIKNNQIRCLLRRGCHVTVVPWNHDFNCHMKGNHYTCVDHMMSHDLLSDFDGLFLSNGPGDPTYCSDTISNISKYVNQQTTNKPLFGICLGHQLLSLAIGTTTFKMK